MSQPNNTPNTDNNTPNIDNNPSIYTTIKVGDKVGIIEILTEEEKARKRYLNLPEVPVDWDNTVTEIDPPWIIVYLDGLYAARFSILTGLREKGPYKLVLPKI